jgi:hypothetical protein
MAIMTIADMFWVLLHTHFVGPVEIITQPCNEQIFLDAIDLTLRLREDHLPRLEEWRKGFLETFGGENVHVMGGKQCRITIEFGVKFGLRLLGVENGYCDDKE